MSTFIADYATSYVRVRGPQRSSLADTLRRAGAEVSTHDDELRVTGLDTSAVGEVVFRAGLDLHELTLVRSSLEDAFMSLTADSVDYRAKEGVAA